MRRFTVVALMMFVAGAMATAQDAHPAKSNSAKPADTATAPTQATVEAFLKRMFSYQPGLQFKVVRIAPAEAPGVTQVVVAVNSPEGVQNTVFYVLPGGKWAIAGDLIPFGADPFGPARQQLQAKAHGPSRGPAGSPVHIVEFSDLQCPACKAAQPTIDKLLQDLPNARFTFQNFPLEQIHPWAFKAAEYADCVGRAKSDAFWKFIALSYANQQDVTVENADQKLKQFATEAGADANAVTACVAQPATAARVRESIELGKAVHVSGTPTLFINGRKVGNVGSIPYEVLKSLAETTPNH
ncbi:MAG: DsbA family protein [Terriglobales bacterium]